jgi:hypothetical protein
VSTTIPDDSHAQPHTADWPRPDRWIPAVVLAAATAYVFWLGQPHLVFAPGSPDTTDLGGHIVALKHLIDVSLPSGHLLDWSHQWFGGYPSFYFYFPLPALVIAALTVAMPLDNAAKLVAVTAPALLPICTYVLVRSSGFPRFHGCVAALGAVTSLSLTTQYIHGGNILSSVIGEYSYALGLCLLVLYMARLARAAAGSNETVSLSVLLCATALTHLVPTMFAVLVSGVLLTNELARRQVLVSWVAGFGLSAFWSLPFLVRSTYMSGVSWGYAIDLSDVLPLPILMVLGFTLAVLPALRPRLHELRLLVALGVVGLLIHLVPQDFFAQGRALPMWYYAVYVLTGVGLAESFRRARAGPRRILWAAGMAALLGVSLAQAHLIRDRSAVLLSSERADSEAYGQLIDALRELPPGLLHWEHRAVVDSILGSTIGLARVPLHVPHLRTTLGLLGESAVMKPAFTRLQAETYWHSAGEDRTRTGDDDDIDRLGPLRRLGVDYLVTFSAGASAWAGRHTDRVELLAASNDWTLWSVDALPLVEPLDYAGSDTAPSVALTHRRIRFTTPYPRTPHLLRVAYFPNWRTDDGSRPALAGPGFMVFVPDGVEVELRFERTWVELAGLLLSVVSVVGVLVLRLRGGVPGRDGM